MLHKNGSVIGENSSHLRFNFISFLVGAAFGAFIIYLKVDAPPHQEIYNK